MTIDFNKKIDLLWKKINYGVSETSLTKQPYEEHEKSEISFFSSDIWQEDLSIPAIPTEVPGITALADHTLVLDPTDNTKSTFLCVANPSQPTIDANRLRDFIPFGKSPLYEVKIYSDEARTTRVYPNEVNNSWVFDYSAGILWFPEGTTYTRLYVSGYRYIGKKGVGPIFTGDTVDVIRQPTGGSYVGGYLDYFVSNETTIADAVDGLNRALNQFIPKGPDAISEFSLTIPAVSTSFMDARIVLAAGYDAGTITLNLPEDGYAIDKLIGTKVETLPIGPFGNGNSGILTLSHNDVTISDVTLTGSSDVGTYGNLQIMSDVSMPADFPGFRQGIVARVVDLTAEDNLNSISMEHSQTGETSTLYFYRETDLTIPTINEATVSVVEDSETIIMSSGIPHYGRGTKFVFETSVADLATNLTLSTKNIEYRTIPNKVGEPVYAVPGNFGLPEVLGKGDGYDVSGVIFDTELEDDSNAHGSINFEASARNANGSTEYVIPQLVNIMNGVEQTLDMSPVMESGIPVINMGDLVEGGNLFATRIPMDNTRFPVWSYGNDLPTTWDSLMETNSSDASIVGGAIRFDKTDYTNVLPSGPNYSNKDDSQFITFAIRRAAVNDFIIDVEGTYTNLYISLPESGEYPYVVNGWISAREPYAGYGTPGKDVSGGCAVGKPAFGGTQSIRVTFGETSSSANLNNIILVRFEMSQGNVITGLRFLGV